MAPRWRNDDDDEFDSAFDDALDESERDDDDEVPCPYCGKPVFEDAPRCPHCERYITDVDAPPRMKPLWIVIGTLACLYAITRWVFG